MNNRPPPSAAQALYGHLKSGAREPVQRRGEPSIGDAMWPSLSQQARQQQAREARAQAELKARSKRTAENLQSVLDAIRREKEREGR
jgi:hypothetical protein